MWTGDRSNYREETESKAGLSGCRADSGGDERFGHASTPDQSAVSGLSQGAKSEVLTVNGSRHNRQNWALLPGAAPVHTEHAGARAAENTVGVTLWAVLPALEFPRHIATRATGRLPSSGHYRCCTEWWRRWCPMHDLLWPGCGRCHSLHHSRDHKAGKCWFPLFLGAAPPAAHVFN